MFKEKECKLENYFWNKGDPSKIRAFYNALEDKLTDNKSYSFYSVAGTGDRLIHSGIPQRITNTIVDLIGVDNVQVVPNVEADTKIVDPIFKEYKLLDKLEKSIKHLTWAGEAFAKFSVVNGDITIDMVNPLNAVVIESLGQILEYQFIIKDEEEIEAIRGANPKKERTIEIYGYGYIRTEVQEKNLGTEVWETVRITSNITFDLNTILVCYISIPDDAYSINRQLFDAMDEGLSRMVDEARKGGMERFIDEDLIPVGQDGQKIATESAKVKDWIKLQGVKSEDGKPLIDFIMADIDPDKRYLIVDKALVKKSVGNSGLSFHTFEGEDVGTTPSAESQREMEKQSIRTRKRYVNRLKGFISDIYDLILELEYNQLTQVNTVVTAPTFLDEQARIPEIAGVVATRELENKVSVVFEDYIQNSLENRIKTWGSQEAVINFPIEFRIQRALEGELADNDIAQLVAKVKEEQGMMLDNTANDED